MSTITSIIDLIVKKGCTVKILHGKSAEEECCICDVNFLSEVYEDAVLYEIGDKNSLYGFFIYDKEGNLIVSSVVNLPTTQDEINENTLPTLQNNNINPYSSLEVMMLCANLKHRIKGMASLLMDLIEAFAIGNNKSHIVLAVSRAENNKKAIQFYLNKGFVPSIQNWMIKEL